jgi:hypothetical protein
LTAAAGGLSVGAGSGSAWAFCAVSRVCGSVRRTDPNPLFCREETALWPTIDLNTKIFLTAAFRRDIPSQSRDPGGISERRAVSAGPVGNRYHLAFIAREENQMRLIKLFGLAAIAAVAAMALMGASSAMATSTVLCKVNELKCPAGSEITGHIEATATNPVLLNSVTNVTCKKSTILGNALGLANPLVGHLELVDFTEDCLTEGKTACTVTATELGLLLLLKTGPNHGNLIVHNTQVNVKCGFIINCTYSLPLTTELLVLGSKTPLNTTTSLALIHATEEVLNNSGGGFCPETSKWDALYSVQLPHEVFIAE